MSEKENMEYKPEVKVEGEQDQERRHVVTFKRPYLFERKEYAEVDLSGLDELTVKDAIEVQRQLFGQQEVAASLLTETTTAFAQALAVRASGKPVEFFKLMKKPFYRPVFRYVREYVMSVEQGVENHVMRLEKPCFFEGKEYREIDLNGVADLNSMQAGGLRSHGNLLQLPVRLRRCEHGNWIAGGVLYKPADLRGREAEKRGE